jgi:hypothetical protein
MVRFPWTEDELKIVLENPQCSPREFSRLLPSKTPGAISVVQAAIHSFHLGRTEVVLPDTLVKRLAEDRRKLVCPFCGAQFQPAKAVGPTTP